MNYYFLSFLLVLVLVNYSECGPDIFKFTSQPESTDVSSGGSVTLTCVAVGRSSITYSWYKLASGFATPPSGSDIISGETGTTLTVQATDVDDSGEKNMFQCKATAGDDVILSDVATVTYTIPDKIIFTPAGNSYIDHAISTGSSIGDADTYIYSLRCNPNEGDLDSRITNGKPYNVYWYKKGETGRVEMNHLNMWTYLNKNPSKLTVDAGGIQDFDSPTLNRYDLVIFNIQSSDKGTYSCKAVSEGDSVLLGSTVLTVGAENDVYIYPKYLVSGYTVQAVDDNGNLKPRPDAGDEVVLMCGAACRTSNTGTYDAQYQWKDSSDNIIASTKKHTVTITSSGTYTYKCVITNANCGSPGSTSVTFTAGSAKSGLKFTFSSPPPEYMWYDTSDQSTSHSPFEIDCDGSGSPASVTFLKTVYKIPTAVDTTPPYDFDTSITPDKSGVYQCAVYNDGTRALWVQKTTNVMIAAAPTATITPSSLSVQDGTAATFTCAIGGYPIESVTITGPNSMSLDCLTATTSGTVSCTSSDQINYKVEVASFTSSNKGTYTCTVRTKWYKTDGTLVNPSITDTIVIDVKYADCTALDSTLENVAVVDPQLPVEHGTEITLGCTAGHGNIGGDKARCQNGQIHFTDEPPHCRAMFMCQDSNMVHRIRAIAFKEARDAFLKQLKRPGGPNPNLFSRRWISREINRSEAFVKTNWNRDPYDLDC